MGEFMGRSGDDHSTNNVNMGGDQAPVDGVPTGYNTDVEGVMANDIVRQGKDEFPCFDVDSGEFYQNMQDGRRRIRFKGGTPAQEYMSKTKYNRAFYVRTTDADGKKFVRKIK